MKILQVLTSCLKSIMTLVQQQSKQTKFRSNGKEINLTSDNTTITSTNFNVDKNGNMTCSNATINGGTFKVNASSGTEIIKITDSSNSNRCVSLGSNYSEFRNIDGISYISIANNQYGNPEIHLAGSGVDNTRITPTSVSVSDGSQSTTIFSNVIYTPTLTQTSKESKKKNITEYNEKALDIVKDSKIYTYNFKSEDDKHKKHIGFVIGDEGGEYKTPEQVISNDREGIESYSMTSVLWKAFQEYIAEKDNQIQQLQNEIKELKKECE